MEKKTALVTGAYGNTGRAIAERLLDRGYTLRTLTDHPANDCFDDRVRAFPYTFREPEKLHDALTGCQELYNTYWVRFDHGRVDRDLAVTNSQVLFEAAKRANVKRIVHLSITNPNLNSRHPYFRGKARIEQQLQRAGLAYTILRPAIVFGGQNILINNICWLLRHFPIFGLFGDGKYLVQPIHIDDLAELAVEEGDKTGNRIVNAIGPETLEFGEMVRRLALAMGVKRRLLPMPTVLVWLAGKLMGLALRDVTITWGEIRQLQEGLLAVQDKAQGHIRITAWAKNEGNRLGQRYANELARRRIDLRPLTQHEGDLHAI